MPKDNTYDTLIKVLIVGDSGVGKTNMLLRFCENNFMNSHLTTIGTSLLRTRNRFQNQNDKPLRKKSQNANLGHCWTVTVQNYHPDLLQGSDGNFHHLCC